MPDHAAKSPADLHAAFASVARAIAESLDVKEVWDRVASCCRAIASFDAMGIVRLEPDGRVSAVAAAGEEQFKALAGRVYDRAGFSPQLWPQSDEFMVVVRDADRELDRSYVRDRMIIGANFRSVLRVPLGQPGNRLGSVLLM